MRIVKIAAAALLGLSALGLAGCATGLPTQVSRFQAMPAPQGQSFFVVPARPGRRRRARILALCRPGRAGDAGPGLCPGAEPRKPRPCWSASIMASTRRSSRSSAIPSRAAMAMTRSSGGGFYDPVWGGYLRPALLFALRLLGPALALLLRLGRSLLRLWRPRRQASGSIPSTTASSTSTSAGGPTMPPLFEGHAQARSANDNLGVLVPNLIEAMFTGFPGRSGETVKITVPPPAAAARLGLAEKARPEQIRAGFC